MARRTASRRAWCDGWPCGLAEEQGSNGRLAHGFCGCPRDGAATPGILSSAGPLVGGAQARRSGAAGPRADCGSKAPPPGFCRSPRRGATSMAPATATTMSTHLPLPGVGLHFNDGRGDDDHPRHLRSPTWSRTRAAPLPPGCLEISAGVLVRALLDLWCCISEE